MKNESTKLVKEYAVRLYALAETKEQIRSTKSELLLQERAMTKEKKDAKLAAYKRKIESLNDRIRKLEVKRTRVEQEIAKTKLEIAKYRRKIQKVVSAPTKEVV